MSSLFSVCLKRGSRSRTSLQGYLKLDIITRKLSDLSHSSSSAASIFDNIVQSRGFTQHFDSNKPIDSKLIEKILRLSQLAPSSFNLQPYKIILIQEKSMRDAVADTMLGGNGQRVKDAPLTVVYISHREPAKLTRQLMALESAAGTHAGYVSSLPSKLSFLLGNGGWISDRLKAAVTHLTSPISAAPVIPVDSTGWSVKNTIFAAQTFMLAATANGLYTAPMEGYDERRLCYALDIPMSKYTVPLIICTGYIPIKPNDSAEKIEAEPFVSRRRYSLEDICYTDKYNNSWKSEEK